VSFTNCLFSFEKDHIIEKIVAIPDINLNIPQVNGLATGHDHTINITINTSRPKKSAITVNDITQDTMKLPIYSSAFFILDTILHPYRYIGV